MASNLRLRRAVLFGLSGFAMSVGPSLALAQNAPAASKPKEASKLEEVVVTGTLIRGIEPVGSNVVGISKEQIESTGAINMNRLLSQMPQATDFNTITQPGGGVLTSNNRVPITRPNFRSLPGGGGSSSGAVTLVLINGHRVVPVGIEQTAVDPDVLAPGLTERVESILDGASAVYGSDAVGGVLNFITLKKFDGTKVSAAYGTADSYSAYDLNLTSGTAWEGGSFFGTYSFGKNDPLFGGDRDYVKGIDWRVGIPSGSTCDLANVSISAPANNYYLPTPTGGLSGPTVVTPGTPTPSNCNTAALNTLFPASERHNAYLAFTHELGDSTTFAVDALYSRRTDVSNSGPFTGTVTIGPTNPYYRQIAGGTVGQSQSVSFSYGPVSGNKLATNETELEVGQVTPSLTIDVNDNWQIRALVGYGRSTTSTSNVGINSAAQTTAAAGTTLNTALNPYNIAATQNLALIGNLIFTNNTAGRFAFFNPRAVIDGKLFSMPGGDLRLAVGAEYAKTDLQVVRTDTSTLLKQAPVSASQNVTSGFAEVLVPFVGNDNRMAGVEKLELSLSGRYDKYDEGFNKFSPKIAVTYDPFDWVTVRGNWGESFNAPTVSDKLGAQSSLIRFIPAVIQAPVGTPGLLNSNPPSPPCPGGAGRCGLLIMTGSANDLQPQSATNWSAGLDFRTPIGLTVSTTYYKIDFKDILSLPSPTASLARAFTLYPELFQIATATTPLTASQIANFAAQVPTSGPGAAAAAAGGGFTVVGLYDIRTRNLTEAEASGIDLQVAYEHSTGFGSIDARLNGNYQFQNDLLLKAGQPAQNGLRYYNTGGTGSRLRAALSVGANVGDFRAQATLNHSKGAALDPTTVSLCTCQTTIDDFNVVNLFFRYNVDGDRLAQDLAFSLNVDNALDTDPPVYKINAGGNGFGNGATLGRLFRLSVNKTF